MHDGARSDLFDINRVRHIIEPNMTLWYGWDSHPNGAFPIYDQQVEGATGGAAAQVGLRQVLQTQRGGPGNWTSVDFLEVDVGAVFNDSADDFQRSDVLDPATNAYNPYAWVQSPYPQFYRYEPELSQWGTHAYTTIAWQLSSTLTFATSGIFGFTPREVVDLTSSQPQIKNDLWTASWFYWRADNPFSGYAFVPGVPLPQRIRRRNPRRGRHVPDRSEVPTGVDSFLRSQTRRVSSILFISHSHLPRLRHDLQPGV